MKKLMPVVVLGVILALGAGVYAGTHYLANHYLTSNSASKDCEVRGEEHFVVIRNDEVKPAHTFGALCDTLTITNQDDRIRLIAFGEHDHHQAYDNVTEKALAPNQTFTIVLNKLDTYRFHDHDQETTAGYFTVTE